MVKKIKNYIKLQLVAGNANPSPPIGPALGQHGLNIMKFCKEFNTLTKLQQGIHLSVIITVYSDKSFSFIIKTPLTVMLLKKAAKLNLDKKPGSGAKHPGREKVGNVTVNQIKEIAIIKKNDLNCYTIENAIKIISGTARSVGIEIT
jgi:large subunit ribosomal protein L11